jgi:calcium-dependent protein kinase
MFTEEDARDIFH